jgi:hypothetical protein
MREAVFTGHARVALAGVFVEGAGDFLPALVPAAGHVRSSATYDQVKSRLWIIVHVGLGEDEAMSTMVWGDGAWFDVGELGEVPRRRVPGSRTAYTRTSALHLGFGTRDY